ncbi:MAG: sortase [Candidatus Pacebacteria bacterium]|nr:sortase [Candidatus Paceibacterota bacterium]
MERIVHIVVRLTEAGRRVYAQKWSFGGVFAVVFLGSVFTLASFDLLPNAKASVASSVSETRVAAAKAADEANPVAVSELPTNIEIPTIGLKATIANPTTIDVETLDAELLKGAVRYPTSARLGETGNVVLFGHSSYLPIVNNQAYKTFNGIQKLVAGDTITVYSAGAAYTYRVRSVAKESAATNAGISLVTTGRVLTLSTCNSFGTKTDRFVVTADFVESHSVSA